MTERHFERLFLRRPVLSSISLYGAPRQKGLVAAKFLFSKETVVFSAMRDSDELLISRSFPKGLKLQEIRTENISPLADIIGRTMYMYWLLVNNLSYQDGISIEFAVDGPHASPSILHVVAKAGTLDIYCATALDL
jgi:hypothetical protein